MLSSSQLHDLQQLKRKKYRIRRRQFLIEGTNLCEAALLHNAALEMLIVASSLETSSKFEPILQMAQERGITIEVVPERHIKKLSNTKTPQGIVGLVSMRQPLLSSFQKKYFDVVLLLDRVSDPGNLGTLLRAADWFGISAVFCSPNCADVFNGKTLRASAGSIFHIPSLFQDVSFEEVVPDLIKKRMATIWVADPRAETSCWDVQFEPPLALILGHERLGPSKSLYAYPVRRVRIPSFGQGESLNVAMAGVILLAEITRQWKKQNLVGKDQAHEQPSSAN